MIKQRLEKVREKIDGYAREAVRREVERQATKLTEDYLRPIAETFLSSSLEAYVQRHMQEALEQAVASLEGVFDEPTEAPARAYEEPEETDVFGRSFLDEEEIEESPVLLANRLLAFIQVYQEEHNTEFAPKQKRLADQTGLRSMQIIRLYSELREQGRIEGPITKGRNSVIRILKPLSDPRRYL